MTTSKSKVVVLPMTYISFEKDGETVSFTKNDLSDRVVATHKLDVYLYLSTPVLINILTKSGWKEKERRKVEL